VVDDGSTDNTPDILRSYGKDIRVFRRERTSEFRSVSEANNIALEHATGDWWHHDAADCWLEPTWAEEVIDFIRGREVNGVHTDFITHFYEGGEKYYRVAEIYDARLSTLQNYLRKESLGGWLFKMDLARRAGPWDTRFPRKQTREWTSRVLAFGDLVYYPRALWHFVFHEPDQQKNLASIKYRLLGDLKNSNEMAGNINWALRSPETILAMLEAFREFFTDPRWEKERESSIYGMGVNLIKKKCDNEASEDWEPLTFIT
jgi:glycosyltransferase involved in cell wall biosynthesis